MSLPDSRLANFQPGVVVEKQRFSGYTMMLMLSLVAIIIACVCLNQELKLYDWDYKAASARP